MAYTANVPSRMRIAERYGNRTNDNNNISEYFRNQEGLPGSYNTIIQYLSSEAIFYTVEDVAQLTGWSKKVVHRLFNKRDFPATNIGKHKLVESHALIAYFAVKRERDGGDWE